MVNHLFNSTFDWLSTLPAGPLTNLLEGTLVLVRRALFLVPTGVTATQAGTELVVKVNTGSVAYVRQDGNSIEVSGLPSFAFANQFDAGSVAEVSVANSGNAGCAGFVLESGHVAAALQTNQIDSMRFGPDARFDDTVTATVTGGPLLLQDAVRGGQGVDIYAPVVLKNNVEVEGGNCEKQGSTCDVTFHDTVDAAAAGKQSLTVTALGTTTFDATVGGRAALASLLTRGVTPLKIDQSADTKTVGLHYLPFVSTDSNGNVQVQVKYGIDVAVGDNPSQMYEFDTGGNSFFAGYNPAIWKNVPLTPDAITVTFSSGNTFNSVVANGKVTIGTGAQTLSTDQPIRLGAILEGSNPNKGETFVFTNPDAPPIEGSFFGDFGASFDVFNVRQTGQLMASPLLQLPGNLHNGFLVQLGPIGTTEPQLTVGITDALRNQFPYAVPVSVASPPQTYPVAGYPVLNLFGISPTYSADGPQGELPIGCGTTISCPTPLQTVIDSGAPSTSLRVTEGTPYEVGIDGKDKGQLAPGADLIATFPTTAGRPPLTWVLTAGNNSSVNAVGYGGNSVATSGQNVNTGLNFYNNFDVMFDAQQQVIWLRPNDGLATVVAGSVTTTGDQTFKQNAELGGTYTTGGGAFTVGGVTQLSADVLVNAGGGNVSFFGTVDAATSKPGIVQSLVVNTTGTTTFTRAVGGQMPLQSVTTSGGNTATAGVTTYGSQQYGHVVSLSGLYEVLSNGSFAVAGDATLTGPVVISNNSPGGVSFGGRIDSSQRRGYSLNISAAGGSVDLNGDVGAAQPLGGLSVDALPIIEGGSTAFTAKGSVNLDGSLGNSTEDGLSIGTNVDTKSPGVGSIVANLAQGGVIRGFSANGIDIGSSDSSSAHGFVSGTVGRFVVSGNGKAGIATENTQGLALNNNALIGNGTDGITTAGDTDLTITANDVNSNKRDGIMVTVSRDQVQTNNSISKNTISGNGRHGVTIDGESVGNRISSNSIFSNGPLNSSGEPVATEGISLQNGGNAGQLAPQNVDARITGLFLDSLTVKGAVVPYSTDYTGTYTLEIFVSPSADAPNVQGRTLLVTQSGVPAGDFNLTFDAGSISVPSPGSFITVTATPTSGPANTSELSTAAEVKF